MDYDDVRSLYTNLEVRKFLGGIRDEKSIKAAMDDIFSPNENSFYWVVKEKRTDQFLGLVSLTPHHDGVYQEISYQLLPSWWGKGYATEVVQHIINYSLSELNLSELVAETQTANMSSCKLLESVGMTLERTVNRFGAEQAIYSIKSKSRRSIQRRNPL